MNLFKFATKELSQDAFLCWLFSNFNNSQNTTVKNVCYQLLKKFTGFNLIVGDISQLSIRQQWAKIDVSIDFIYKHKRYFLVIEDKTTSSEHNQLISYRKSLDRLKWNSRNKDDKIEDIFYVYYKTSLIDKDELSRINYAKWNNVIWDINNIYDFFMNYKDTGSEILDNYSEYIEELYNSYNCERKPISLDHDYIAWESYFSYLSKNKLIENCNFLPWFGSNRYGYSFYGGVAKGFENNEIPYLEIRSRDCLGNMFQARILLYGKKKFQRGQPMYDKFKEVIENKESKYFFPANSSQQIGLTKRYINIDEKEFILMMKKTIEEYIDICEEFRKYSQVIL